MSTESTHVADTEHPEERPIVAHFSVNVEQVDGFEFRVRFDKSQYAELGLDEPAPLGRDTAPNAARILAAAIGNCLSASLVFCTKRSGVALQGLETDVSMDLVRNAQKRVRIGKVEVVLHPRFEDQASLADCLERFEDFCVVTQSVREGLDVRVHVDTRSAAALA
jgi:uncharacterized OsmC-like protein